MDGFKGHNLGQGRVNLFQLLIQVHWVIVPEDVFGRPGVAYALYHRGVVTFVRDDVAA